MPGGIFTMLRRVSGRILLAGALGLGFVPLDPIYAQTGPTKPAPPAANVASSVPEVAILQALASYPATAPYRFSTSIGQGKIRLVGRVGTKQVHDTAIQIALQVSSSIDDRIVIDTAAAHQAANTPMGTQPIPGFSTPGAPLTGGGGGGGYAYRGVDGFPATYGAYSGVYGAAPYFYPQPLFGRLDEPFYGFSPPVISYPPWATAVRYGNDSNRNAAQQNPQITPLQNPPNAPAPEVQPAKAGANARATSTSSDTVEMTLDAQGVATLRGSVPTVADKIAVGQKVSLLPGIRQVVNQLTARDDPPPPAANANNNPPPPPVPAGQEEKAAVPKASIQPDAQNGDLPMDRRLADAIARRPALANLNVKATARDGVAYLSGTVPSAMEAMLAFRAAQQTPGIREVVDKLEFTVPDGQVKNPLIERGRPEDVEPYLEAQIRRQVGDQAHIDRVRVSGNQLEVKGTVPKVGDKPRVEAILRSMPLVRGFKVESEFLPE